MDENQIIARITSLYPDAAVDVNGADCSFEVYVISEHLNGKSTLQRQQSLLDLFKDELKCGKLHALSIKARTPMEQAATAGLVQIQL
jgi:acid stress-induced BolA-like protein IbaG/YrbA